MYMTKRVLFFVLLSVLFFFLASFAAAVETGGASWYGGKFQGRRTANGEIFDTNKFTAAHKTLPFNTIVEVTNLNNNKTVLVRINDRGPFVEGRIIDLSRAAAEKIGLVGKGVTRVEVKIVKDTGILREKGILGKYPGLTIPEKKDFKNSGRITVQVASFFSSKNAEKVKKTLIGSNFSPVVEYSSSGYFRILLKDIANADVEDVKGRLSKIGFPSVLLRRQ